MNLALLLAVAVPAAFLYAIHWLNLYGSDRPRLLLACVLWGLVAFLLSFATNRFCIDVLGWSRVYVSTRSAPIVEEIFKAGLLFFLVRRGRFSYFVDGGIYGFACGIGFAMIENLRYLQLFPQNPLSLVVVRDFSSALAHGTATALTGIALGRFALARGGRGHLLPLMLGLAGAISMHYIWNNFANFSPYPIEITQWILVSVGLLGVALLAFAISMGLRRERRVLREALASSARISAEESRVIDHLGDLDHLLAPIDRCFGRHKRAAVARLLHLEARIGLHRDAVRRASNAVLRAQLEREIAAMEAAIDAARQEIGVYAMLYVRSLYPATAWSLWARLGQALVDRTSTGMNVWRVRTASRTGASGGLFDRLSTALHARADAHPHGGHGDALPEPMRHCLEWAARAGHVTLPRLMAELGHDEARARALLSDLLSRGLLHRHESDGDMVFRVRAAPGFHLWHRARRDQPSARSA